MHKRNWNKIERVFAHLIETDWIYLNGKNTYRTKKTITEFEYESLYDAVVKHHYTWSHNYNMAYYSVGRHITLFDEMGMKIPDWKVEEVYKTVPEKKWRKRKFKFRDGPVEGVSTRRWGRFWRRIKTTQEIRENEFLAYDDDAIEYNIKARDRRKQYNLPTLWDDRPRHREQNWKRQRKTQWKAKNENS